MKFVYGVAHTLAARRGILVLINYKEAS